MNGNFVILTNMQLPEFFFIFSNLLNLLNLKNYINFNWPNKRGKKLI